MPVTLFLDTEFTGLCQKAQLISIALFKDENSYFYAEFNDYDESLINEEFLQKVIGRLQYKQESVYRNIQKDQVRVKDNAEIITTELKLWLQKFELDTAEIWADVLAYDWVLFCELFGGARKLPEFILYIPFDLATLAKEKGLNPDFSRVGLVKEHSAEVVDDSVHNALFDARIAKFCFDIIMNLNKNNKMGAEKLLSRLENYRVDFAYAKGTYFAAASRLKKKYQSKERWGQWLSIFATVLSIAVLTVLQFYLVEKLGNIAIYIVTALAFVSVIISIYLFFHKNPERYIAYHNRAEEYLLLYKQAKDAEARFADNLLTPLQLNQEIDRLFNAQARLITIPLETEYEDYLKSKKGIDDGELEYTFKDFQNT